MKFYSFRNFVSSRFPFKTLELFGTNVCLCFLSDSFVFCEVILHTK